MTFTYRIVIVIIIHNTPLGPSLSSFFRTVHYFRISFLINYFNNFKQFLLYSELRKLNFNNSLILGSLKLVNELTVNVAVLFCCEVTINV